MIEELYYNKNYNLKKAIELIFTSDNQIHTGLMISKLNENMYDLRDDQ